MVGLVTELALLDHFESFTQWIPLGVLGAGIIAAVAVAARPNSLSLRIFQVTMLVSVASGLAGLYFHFAGNVEFAVERNSELRGIELVWKSLRGATPALAPAALTQLGLFGLLYCYNHPALENRSIAT